MMVAKRTEDDCLLADALRKARTTRRVGVQSGLRHAAARVYEQLFGTHPVVIIADSNTFAAAGRDVVDSFRRAAHRCLEPHVFDEPDFHAEYRHVETLERTLAPHDAIPLVVGSGTLNDLVKMAAHRVGRPYLVLATAASMDGYAAFGASITFEGSKQTFDCPAPVAILADLEVIEAAPRGMNASGYADLSAKINAGADWIIADALGVETIDATAWQMLQKPLRSWLENPEGVHRGDSQGVRCLTLGLLISGLAMQWTRTSRVASGAEHQFSHLWDMQHHRFQGAVPSHGFKVGIGTLASTALYEQLFSRLPGDLDIDRAVSSWPDSARIEAVVRSQFDQDALIAKALLETKAKYIPAGALRAQLGRLQRVWPDLKARLRAQLLPFAELSARLTAAGCPAAPEQIGVSRPQLRDSYRQAYHIRRRFTVLDLAVRTGLFESSLDTILGREGPWATAAEKGSMT